jgi:hypothetical protein
LRLAEFMAEPAPTQHSVDWLSEVGYWPMYGNDEIGDCTCAAAGHMIQAWMMYGQHSVVEPNWPDILQAYSAVSGYDPKTGANDNGAVMQDVLDYWRKAGIGGDKILAFAEVDLTNIPLVINAIELFGGLYWGFNVPEFAMQQFEDSQDWDVGLFGSPQIIGGHAINIGAYDLNFSRLGAITWAKRQNMSLGFFTQYGDEGWIVITKDWLDRTGHSPGNLDLYALGEKLHELTGDANPFRPDPPQPNPEPTPATDPADLALAAAAHSHFSHVRYKTPMNRALKAWLKAKNL